MIIVAVRSFQTDLRWTYFILEEKFVVNKSSNGLIHIFVKGALYFLISWFIFMEFRFDIYFQVENMASLTLWSFILKLAPADEIQLVVLLLFDLYFVEIHSSSWKF
jgi:hypothetical protein